MSMPLSGLPALHELRDDALGEVRPPVFLAVAERGKGGALPVLVIHGKETQVGVLAARYGDPDGEIDGHGEDKAVVVVGMLADKVDPAGAEATISGVVPYSSTWLCFTGSINYSRRRCNWRMGASIDNSRKEFNKKLRKCRKFH